jgi:hypothetical protein
MWLRPQLAVLLFVVVVVVGANAQRCFGARQAGHQDEDDVDDIQTDRLESVATDEPSPGGGQMQMLSRETVSDGGLVSRLDKRSMYDDLASLMCPTEPAEPAENSNGAKLYLHKPNEQAEFVMLESKVGALWLDEDIDRLPEEGFDSQKPTLIYIGGWMQPTDVSYFREIRKSLDKLARENSGNAPYNMMIFDWSNYISINYVKSVSLVPHMADVLARLLERLIDRHGHRAELMHIISYSLSTHVAGTASRQLKANKRGLVGQITALDPTGVCFHSKEYTDFEKKFGLRPTDAKLVVARHYNMNQLGAHRLIGGVDIKINGGKIQPRMEITSLSIREMVGSFGSWPVGSHCRAIQHEAVEFNNKTDCHEVAYECPSFRDFRMGRCAECGDRSQSCMLISTIGNIVLNLNPANVNYKPRTLMHITTGPAQFCVYHYQILAKLKPNQPEPVIKQFESGKFQFELDRGLVVTKVKYRLDLSEVEQVRFTRLLRLDRRIEKFPSRIKLKAPASAALLGSLESVSINFMSNVFADERKRNSIRYCPAKQDELVDCRKTLSAD